MCLPWLKEHIELSSGLASDGLQTAASHNARSIVRAVLQILWSSWEHPLPEIRSLTRLSFDSFISLLSVCEQPTTSQSETPPIDSASRCVSEDKGSEASGLSHGTNASLMDVIARELLALPWHIKGRYGPLAEMVKHLGRRSAL